MKAARLNGPPNSDAIGRGQKVNKEEMLAMMVTLELYFQRDHEADLREWERRVNAVRKAVSAMSGVTSEMFVPEIHYRCPHVRVRWNEEKLGLTVAGAIQKLREGEPSIEVRPNKEDGLELGVWMLEPGGGGDRGTAVGRGLEESMNQMKRKALYVLAGLPALLAGLRGAVKSDKRVVSSAAFPKPLGPYSHAVVAGGFVFVAGQAPINPATQKIELGDIRSETRRELENISTILKTSGSSLENVVKVSIHLVDLADFDAMNEVYKEFFKSEYPAER